MTDVWLGPPKLANSPRIPVASRQPANITRASGAQRTLWVEIIPTATIIALSVSSVAWFTRKNYFFQDDFVFIRQAQQKTLSLSYLRLDLFQHFSPFSRMGDYLLAHHLRASYDWARFLILVMVALAVISFAWSIRTLVSRLWCLASTLLFGQSLALLHLAGWWTAALNILPATILGAGVIGAYVRYRQGQGAHFGVLVVVLFALSLVTHEQSWLVVGYLALLELLVFNWTTVSDGLSSMRNQSLRDAWWVWSGFLVLTALAVTNYLLFYYAQLKPRPSVSQIAHFAGILFGQAFAPSAIGFRPLHDGAVTDAAWRLDVVILVLVIGGTSVAFRGAWRAWTVFVGAFLANALMIGLNRVGRYGPAYGRSLYYVQSPAYLFPLCLALAVTAFGYRFGHSNGWGAHTHRWTRTDRRPIALSLAGVVLILFQLAFFSSARAQESQDPTDLEAHESRSYFSALSASAKPSTSAVVVLDSAVPAQIVLPNFAPFDSLSSTSAVARIPIRVAPPGIATAKVDSSGRLVPLSPAIGATP